MRLTLAEFRGILNISYIHIWRNVALDKLEKNNICKFSNEIESESELFSFQFVFETLPQRLENPRIYPAFCCYLLTEGTAILETEYGAFQLEKDDVFFTFPASSFSIRNCDHAKYLYISFVGNQASEFLNSIGISRDNPICHGVRGLESVWFTGLMNTTSQNLSMLTKGLLLYTSSFLYVQHTQAMDATSHNVIEQIRNTIDCCYANADFSLQYVCDMYQYNPKYISRRFHEIIGISFSDYLQSCRIHHACNFLLETDRSMQEIAVSIGYRDALYFSKVFRKHMGMSPTNYRKKKFSDTET